MVLFLTLKEHSTDLKFSLIDLQNPARMLPTSSSYQMQVCVPKHPVAQQYPKYRGLEQREVDWRAV